METVKVYRDYLGFNQWQAFYKELAHYLNLGCKINKIRSTSRSYTIYIKAR